MISKGFLSASQILRISKINSDGFEFGGLLSSPEIQGYKIGKSLGIPIGDKVNNTIQSTQFSSVWRTSNTSTGSSAINQVTLPLISTGTYNFVVNWGDGTSDTITTWNQAQRTHTYTLEGIYHITITGTLVGWRFANSGDRLKLLEIKNWGTNFRLGATDQHFWGCSNLYLSTVRDVLNLTGTTSLGSSFRSCFALTTVNKINEWNTSAITNLDSTFYDSPDFNGDIGNWDTSNVTNMFNLLRIDSGTSTIGGIFNQDISKWNTSKVTTMANMFVNQINFNQDISTKVVTIGTSTYTAWDTLNVTNMSFTLGIVSPRRGSFNQNIGNWNTSKVTTMTTMFQNQINFNQDISTKVVTIGTSTYTAWDTLNVTNMNNMLGCFTQAIGYFNQNIGNWNTSKVTNIQALFANQVNFNQDISTKVVTIGASTYTAWDTINVTAMAAVFQFNSTIYSGSFNQNIGNWNTSKATAMNAIFFGQINFNQNISTKVVTVGASTYTAWDTINVTTMSSMLFSGSLSDGVFNQNIGNWNTSKVTNINSIFAGQPNFNQDISTKVVTVGASTYTAWDTINVTNFGYSFYCYPLPRQIGSFNQNINNWNTTKVTNMTSMFRYQIGFNQPINNWNVSLVTIFNDTTTGFMEGKTSNDYSTTNYDALLIGWASRPVQVSRVINFGTIKYTSASISARTILTSAPNNWTIVDGGLE